MFRVYHCRANAALILAAFALAGCAHSPPAITEAEGVVLLDGQPLPNAQVQFIPDLKHFGAQFNASAVTDEQGRFQLKCGTKDGAAVGSNWVTVAETPAPRELRGLDEESQTKLAAWQAGLVNRPIPDKYSSVVNTPLKIEITKGQKTYEVKLTRTP